MEAIVARGGVKYYASWRGSLYKLGAYQFCHKRQKQTIYLFNSYQKAIMQLKKISNLVWKKYI